MGRKPATEVKARLAAGYLEHLLHSGLSDGSLRSAAKAMGTSARMLVHHFGSKDRLLAAAVAEFRAQNFERIASRVQHDPSRDVHHHVTAFWRSYTDPKYLRFLQLLMELWVMALRQPGRLPGFLEGIDAWRHLAREQLVQSGMSTDQAEACATLYFGALRGLVLDLLTTNDHERIDRAVQHLADWIDAEVRDLAATPANPPG